MLRHLHITLEGRPDSEERSVAWLKGLSTGAPIVQVYHEKSRILPDVSRVLACLYEKDIQFKTHTTSYKSLLKLQASTHAPVPFYDGPKFLEESREICRYIAEKYEQHGYPFLLGKDALERASVEQWLHNEEHAFNPPSRALFCHLAFPLDKDDDDDISMHTRKLEEVLEVYEQRLSDSEYLAGNNFTLADLVHLPNSHYITASKDFLYLYDSRKNVRRWWDAISTRNSWQQVLMHMKRVEDQNKQEELKEQQLKRKDPRRTPGYPLRLHSRKHTTTEPRTILMHPISSMSSSPIAPPTEKNLPIDIPDEAIVSSSQSSPTDHKTSAAQSKETPFQEKPPKKPPIPLQSIFPPATSPATKDASSPGPTKTDPPTRRKPSLSKDVSNKLHVFDYDEAISHTEEDTSYIEPTPRKASETLNTFSGSSTATGNTKTSSILAKEEPEQHSKSDFYKSDITATGVDSQDKDLVPYSERAPQSARPTDTAASKLSTNDVHHKLQVKRWHAATAGLGNLKEDADHLMPIQQVKSSKDGQQQPSQDSEQAASHPGETIQFPDILDTTKKSSGTIQETKGPRSTLHRARPLGAQDDPESRTPAADERKDVSTQLHPDAQPSFQQSKFLDTNQKGLGSISSQERYAEDLDGTMSEEKPVSSDWLKEVKKSQSKAPKAHPAGSQGSKVEKAPSVYQKKHRFTQDSQEQAQIIPSGQKGDAAAPEHKEASYAPYMFDEKLSATSPTREKSHDEFSAEKTHKKDTTDDQKVVPPIWRKEPISQVQPTFGPSQGAAPRGDFSSKLDQWQGASAPLSDVTTSSGGDERGMPTIHQKLTPTSQQGRHSAQGANQMAKESSEKRVEPIEPETSGVQHTSPSFPGVSSAHHATTDGRVKQPIQMQAPTPDGDDIVGDSKPVSTPDGQISEATKASRDPTTFNDDVHHANLATHGVDKNTFRETKVADSTPPPAKPMYTQQPAHSPSRHPEVVDAGDRGRSSKTIPDRQKMLGKKTVTFGEQYSDPLKEAHPSRWKESESTTPTADQSKDLGSLSLEGKGAEAIVPEEKIFSTERLKEALKQSESTTSKAQPSDYRGTIKVEKTSSIYQKRPLVAKDSREQPPIIPAGEKVDGSSLKHQQSSDVPYTSDGKFSALSPVRADIPAKESYRKDTADDQKVVPTLLSQEPTSQVQSSSKPSQDAAPDGDFSSKPSTIAQWQRASAPLKGVNTDSDDNELAMSSNIEQKPKPMPMRQEEPLISQRVNQMARQSSEQTVEPPVQTGTDTSDVQHDAPSLPEASTADHAIIDDKFVKQSISDESPGEPKQMQPITDARPASAPTKRQTPDGHETDDLELASSYGGQMLDAMKAAPDPATIGEGSHVGFAFRPDELGPAEKKFAPSDQGSGDSAEEPSSTEPREEPPVVPTTEQIKALPTVIGQQRTPETREVPTLKGALDTILTRGLHPTSSTEPPRLSFSVERAEPTSSAQEPPLHVVHDSLQTGITPDDAHGNVQSMKPSGQDSVHSEEPPPSMVPRNQAIGDSAREKQQISSMKGDTAASAPDQAKDLQATHGPILPPVRLVSPSSDTQLPSGKGHKDIPANDLGGAKPIFQASAPDTQDEISTTKAAPGEKKFASSEPTSSIEPWNKEIRDSDPSKQLIPSTETRKENSIIATPDQDKDMQTTLDQHGIPSAPVKSGSRSSDIQRRSQKTQADALADDLGEAGSKPSAPVPEVRPHIVVPASTPVMQHGPVLDKEKLVPSGQDSRSTQPRNAYIGDSVPSTQQISSTRPRKGDAAASSPDQAKDSPTPLGRQDILPPIRSVSPYSDTQHPSNKGHEDVPVDGSGETKPIVQASTPGTQDDTTTTEAAPDDKKFAPSEPTSTQPRSEDFRNAAPSTQLISSTETTKGNTIIPAPVQDKDTQTILDQQGIWSATVKSAYPYSDTKRPLQNAREDAPDNDLGEAASKPSAPVREVGPPSVVPASAPATQHGSSRDETLDKPKFVPSDQDYVHSTQPSNGEIEDSPPSAQQISSTRPRKGDAASSAADQAKDSQNTFGRQDVLPSIRSVSPFSATQLPSNKGHEDVPVDGSGEAKPIEPIVQASAPVTQDDTATSEAAPDEKKFAPSEQTSSTQPRSEDTRDAAPSTQLISSAETTKGNTTIAAPVQDKDTQTILDQQGMRSAPVMLASPYSDTKRPSKDAREDAPDNDLGEADSKPSARVREVGPPTVVPASAPATQHGSATDETLDKPMFVPSGQDSVHSTQPRNGDIEYSPPSAQQISSARPRKGDAASSAPDQAKDSQNSFGRQDVLPPIRSVSPSSDTQRPSNKGHEDVPVDGSGEAEPIGPTVQASAPATQDDTATSEAAPDEKKFAPSEPTSSTRPRSEDIRDAAPSTQLISSTETTKGNTIIAAPAQDKETQTILDQQGIRSAPGKSASPYSDTEHPSQDAREDAPDNDLGETASIPSASASVQEVGPPTVVPSAPATQHGSATDETLDKPKFVPSGQDSVHSTKPRNGEIEDSPPSQQISSTRPRKGDAASSAPDQAKDSQNTFGRQDVLSPIKSVSPSSDTQRPSNKGLEDVPEAKPIVQASASVTQDDTATSEAAPDEKKFAPSEPNSTTQPRSEDIRDAAPSAQLISPTEKGNTIVAAPVQDKDTQTILDQHGILSTPVKSASPHSDTKHLSQDAREDAPDNDLGEAASKPSAPVREVGPPTVVPASTPATQHGSASNETLDKPKFVPSGQDFVHSSQPRNGEIEDSAPSAQTRNREIEDSAPSAQTRSGAIEDSASYTAPEAKDSKLTIGRQDMSPLIRSVSPSSDTQRPSSNHEDVPADDLGEGKPTVQASDVDTAKAILPGTEAASKEVQGSTSDDIDTDGLIPRAGQVSSGRHDSHRRGGHATEPYKITVDEKKTTSPSSKAYSSESGSDLTQARTETFFPDHGIQKQPPSATQDISLDASSKAKSSGQGAKVPIASVSETQPGATQPHDEPAPVEKNFAISDQSPHASKSPSAAEPRNGETYVDPVEQRNVQRTIDGDQAAGKIPDARETVTKHQEPTRADDNISNLRNPLVTQEQASHHERASEGPIPEERSPLFDKTALPPSQEQSSDTRPDSTPITGGGAHLSSAVVPATSTIQNQEAQPLPATEAPTTPALQGSASFQNMHADSLENMETPREPSNDQVMAPATSSAAHSDSLKGEPGTTTVQPPQESSFDSPGDEKTTIIQGDQKLERASEQEKSKAKQQIDQSNTESPKDKELNGEIRLNLPSTFGEVQKQPSWESEHQQQAGQAIVPSPEGTIKQVEQFQIRGSETEDPEEREPQGALDRSGKKAPGVQPLSENTKNAPNSTDDAPDDIQTLRNSEDNSRSYEESKAQQQPEGKTQGDFPVNSYLNNSSQSQAEASDKSSKQSSPGIQDKNKSSSRLDGPTDSTKSGDTEDKSP